MTTSLTIQQAAAATGLTVHTLRYYERIGLIGAIPRQHNTHRLYRAEDIRWIEFLMKLRSTGLPVRQMRRYAELCRQGNQPESVSERKAMLQQHTLAMEARFAELQSNLVVIHKKIAMYADLETTLRANPATAPHSFVKKDSHENEHDHQLKQKHPPTRR